MGWFWKILPICLVVKPAALIYVKEVVHVLSLLLVPVPLRYLTMQVNSVIKTVIFPTAARSLPTVKAFKSAILNLELELITAHFVHRCSCFHFS